MKALVGTFNQEKALVGAFSVIVKTDCGTDGSFYSTRRDTSSVRGSVTRVLGMEPELAVILAGAGQLLPG